MVCPWETVARLPDDLGFVEAAPLMCAGITVYNGMRNVTGVRPGDLVAVQGVGGLGHLAIQFARKMGFKVAALSRGPDKKDLAMELGAHYYIDSEAEDPVRALQKLGGAQMIVGAAPSGKAMSDIVAGLSPRGTFLFLAAPGDVMTVDSTSMLSGRAVQGWPSGTSIDSEDTMGFAALQGVKPVRVLCVSFLF
jgi:alcohol dehydrogenase, propanol-preferring